MREFAANLPSADGRWGVSLVPQEGCSNPQESRNDWRTNWRTGREAPARDTGRAMSEKSTTSDLVGLARESIETDDLEAALSFYAPHAVWDASPWGMGVFEGQVAMRGLFEDWRSSYSSIERTAEEIRDLGHGVTFA